jgi:hypothetical protein
VASRILPCGTLPAVLHWGSCYIKGMLYKGYTTVPEGDGAVGQVRHQASPPACGPQKALSGGIPRSFLEPLGRSWSHSGGIYRQKLTRSLKN